MNTDMTPEMDAAETVLEEEEEDEEQLIDQFCDPQNPIRVPFQEVSAAAYKIKDGIQRTPCSVSHIMDLHSFSL